MSLGTPENSAIQKLSIIIIQTAFQLCVSECMSVCGILKKKKIKKKINKEGGGGGGEKESKKTERKKKTNDTPGDFQKTFLMQDPNT